MAMHGRPQLMPGTRDRIVSNIATSPIEDAASASGRLRFGVVLHRRIVDFGENKTLAEALPRTMYSD